MHRTSVQYAIAFADQAICNHRARCIGEDLLVILADTFKAEKPGRIVAFLDIGNIAVEAVGF